jgi:hypothetical protein
MPFTENQGTLDDVITYIHVAAITSASEHKAASMRWWHAAFSLARELKLNKESVHSNASYLTSGSTQANEIHMQETEADPWFGLSSFNFDQGLMDFMEAPSEPSPPNAPDKQQQLNAPNDQEYDEERRRTWWLLYIQDRHLALCYNRNLALLDAECADLLLPLDEAVWQSGSFITDTSASANRPVFPNFECTGHNLFGFFLPLMTIVGEILDHNHAKNHPLLGGYYRNTTHSQGIESEISRQLQCYEESLHRFEAVQIPPDQTINFSTHQHALHTKTVVAYATHVTQVLHILLTGKWDPVSLFDNEDHWMSSPSFTTTMGHAIAAADAVSQILEVDPDLSFIPYFLGIQLLQGSFVLLLIIDRLQTKTDPRIINACEVIIRATEACVATLDTEYQVGFDFFLFLTSSVSPFANSSFPFTAQLPPNPQISSRAGTRSLCAPERIAISEASGLDALSLDEEWYRTGAVARDCTLIFELPVQWVKGFLERCQDFQGLIYRSENGIETILMIYTQDTK